MSSNRPSRITPNANPPAGFLKMVIEDMEKEVPKKRLNIPSM
jgi:hypothetical protein